MHKIKLKTVKRKTSVTRWAVRKAVAEAYAIVLSQKADRKMQRIGKNN